MEKILPVSKGEFFEMRFHSIGGQGAYTTGQMVAAIGAEFPQLKSSIFASYGSEKKGAPVSVFLRFLESDKEITDFSAVRYPNVVVVFHEKLLETIDVLDGLKEDGILIVNTSLSAQELVEHYGLNVEKVVTVDGTAIAIETEAKINTVLFGTIMKELPFFDKEKGESQIKAKLSYKYPELVDFNIAAYQQGYENAVESAVVGHGREISINKYELGYDTQIFGGLIDGPNTQLVDRSISREGFLPAFDKEQCINCTKCDTTCPDDCFIWVEQEGRRGRMEMVLEGINYGHCKGCLRCVEVCPTEALTSMIETRDYADDHTVEKI